MSNVILKTAFLLFSEGGRYKNFSRSGGMINITIRKATQNDLDIINKIYNHYVINSTCTYQTEPESLAERKVWFAHHNDDYPVMVAENERSVIGWGSLSRYRNRAAYKPTVENSIYISHENIGKGIGTLLLSELIRHARDRDFHSIIAQISGDQDASIGLHEKLGFAKVAHLKEVGFKFNTWLDVVFYQLLL
jgi:L-amino acid N-acyltransferase YncA